MMKKTALLIFCLIGAISSLMAQVADLKSPDGSMKVSFKLSDKLYYTISCDDKVLLADNYLQLDVNKEQLGKNPKLNSKKLIEVNNILKPVVPLKFAEVKNKYNELTLNLKGGYSVQFRAYDEGVAYRFVTNKKGPIEVQNEEYGINFPDDYTLHLQQPPGFKTPYEEPYTHIQSSTWNPTDKMSTLPVLIDTKSQYKILISEADLFDYPCMFLKGNGNNGMTSIFPKAPLEFGPDGDRSLKILKEAEYIAKTEGKRNFPWRYFVITKNDGQLLENTLSYKLSTKSEIADHSWIKPGQVSWEWWNDASPYGADVDFVSGYNLETYKYYIDFASKFNIPYIIMDEGWAKTTLDPYTPNPKVDVHELIRYGKEKNVAIVLWLTWLTVDRNMELFETFAKWGVKGVKIDFMDRSDQTMVNFYERVAKEAARHRIMVDFHGSFKPAGLEYKYPNVMSYEGVLGLEQQDRCLPNNTIYLPFMRNAVGAMDFTPGAMINMQPESYASRNPNPGSVGTRAYQMALFVMFESGFQMLCDNPSLYYKNKECIDFMHQVPVTWDETKSLVATIGEVAVVAKRKGNKWFIGGITNDKMRTIDLDLSFLTEGKTYKMTSFEDGINAHRQGMDYRRKQSDVKSGDKLQIKMARNGGWAAVIE